jgi:hypothetical protein
MLSSMSSRPMKFSTREGRGLSPISIAVTESIEFQHQSIRNILLTYVLQFDPRWTEVDTFNRIIDSVADHALFQID